MLVIAVVFTAAAVWAGLSSSPSGEEAAGTIMQAQRYQDEVTQPAEEPPVAEGQSAEDLPEEGADDSTTDRAEAEEADKEANTGNLQLTGP